MANSTLVVERRCSPQGVSWWYNRASAPNGGVSANYVRVFNVRISGNTVLANFDVIANAGAADKADIQNFTETADSCGQIIIAFTNVKNNAQVNAMEIN